jgi:hypothetical protein
MDDDAIARVNYFDRQFLRVQDFTAEQAYHIAMRRRHNVAHHSWGIVEGLQLVVDPADGGIYVQTGMAVDGYAREVVVDSRLGLSPGVFDDRGSDIVDVSLVYDRVGSDAAPPGYAGCGDDGPAPFYRWIERPRLLAEAGDPDPPDRRQPAVVPPADLAFDPGRTPPDDPGRVWPVFLGRVTRDRSDPSKPAYSVDLAGRPYVDLVGEYLRAASGRAAIQLGEYTQAVTGGASTRPGAPAAIRDRRFALFVPEAETTQTMEEPRLAVDKGGQVSIRGDTTVHGDVTVDGRAVEFLAGPARPRNAPPWRIYHLGTSRVDELRIEMARPDTTAQRARTQVVIGSWAKPAAGDGPQAFQKCLTVDANCNVTVHGTLTVEGNLHTDETVQAKLGEEARRLALISAIGGLAGPGRGPAPGPVPGPAPGPAPAPISLPGPEPVAESTSAILQALLAAGGDPATIAEALAADDRRAREFATAVRSHFPELARRLGMQAGRRKVKGTEGKA